MTWQSQIDMMTKGRSWHRLDQQIAATISQANRQTGLCHLFIQHTSASLLITENADPDVRRDLEAFMERLVPDGDAIFRHTLEGKDDMSAHVRCALTQTSLTVPITDGELGLGTWQGIYLWEHRYQGQHRIVTVTVL